MTPPHSDDLVTSTPADGGSTVWIRAHVHNAPAGATLTYAWEEEGWWTRHSVTRTSFYGALAASHPSSVTYTVHVKWEGGGITASHTIDWS